MSKTNTTKYTIPMLEKGFELIELMANHPKGISMQDIVVQLKQPKTSVYRVLNSLILLGYVYKNEESARYSLSKKMLKIGLAALGESNIVEYALPHMQSLRDRIKESVMLGIIMDDRVVLLEQVLGSHDFTFILRPGTNFNLYASAPGKLFLAYSTKEEQERLLNSIKYKGYNSRTIVSSKEMEAEIKKIISSGYSTDLEEEINGVHCIAAPIFNQFGGITAALWTSGPSGRLDYEQLTLVAKEIINASNNISKKLGYEKK